MPGMLGNPGETEDEQHGIQREDRALPEVRVKPCGHFAGRWCNCQKVVDFPEDDPDVIHEHPIQESY